MQRQRFSLRKYKFG
ncbi:MAG: YSIRK-type signal peptide-containing protein, partial [Streptococcus sp.]